MMRALRACKRNITAVVCFLLAAILLAVGTVSYAKYATGDGSSSVGTGIGSFSCSASIAGMSAATFTNAAFWGATAAGDRVAMNALRTLDFTVNNFEETESVRQVSAVQMRYTLLFTAPKSFAERLALQLFDETGAALLPQIALADLISAAAKGSFHTASDAPDDYNGTAATPLLFTVNTAETPHGTAYTAVADGITLRLEPVLLTLTQTLRFRVWDTSRLTSAENKTVTAEAGVLCPPLEVSFEASVLCYRISISHPSFRLPAGTASTAEHSLTLTPTDVLQDEHLDADLRDESGALITEIKAGDTVLLGSAATGVTVTGVQRADPAAGADAPPLVYPDAAGNAFSLYDGEGVQKFFLSPCYSKNYPLSVDVLFEQTAD